MRDQNKDMWLSLSGCLGPPCWISPETQMSKYRTWFQPQSSYLPCYGDTFCATILCGDGFFQLVKPTAFLEFFHQTFHCFLGPFILLIGIAFLPTQQSFDDWGSVKWHHCHHLAPAHTLKKEVFKASTVACALVTVALHGKH